MLITLPSTQKQIKSIFNPITHGSKQKMAGYCTKNVTFYPIENPQIIDYQQNDQKDKRNVHYLHETPQIPNSNHPIPKQPVCVSIAYATITISPAEQLYPVPACAYVVQIYSRQPCPQGFPAASLHPFGNSLAWVC